MSTQHIKKGAGAQNILVDILDTFGNREISLTYVSSITINWLRSDQTSATAITLVAGTLGTILSDSFVHYSNGVYQLGLPSEASLSGENVLIQWSGASILTGEKLIDFQGTTLGFAESVSFSTDYIIKLRYLINDLDESNYTYSDNRLAQLITVAACYVKTDLGADYVVDIEGGTITPDQSSDVMNLIIMRAACMLTKSELKTGASSGIRITDGWTTVDYKGVSEGLKLNATTFCDDYLRALAYHLMGQPTNGQLISTPKSLD